VDKLHTAALAELDAAEEEIRLTSWLPLAPQRYAKKT
jgi:hypothetical protein